LEPLVQQQVVELEVAAEEVLKLVAGGRLQYLVEPEVVVEEVLELVAAGRLQYLVVLEAEEEPEVVVQFEELQRLYSPYRPIHR
jgi:hypothetical protein